MADEILYRAETWNKVTETRRCAKGIDSDRRRITGETHFATPLEAWNAIVKRHEGKLQQANRQVEYERENLFRAMKLREDCSAKR